MGVIMSTVVATSPTTIHSTTSPYTTSWNRFDASGVLAVAPSPPRIVLLLMYNARCAHFRFKQRTVRLIVKIGSIFASLKRDDQLAGKLSDKDAKIRDKEVLILELTNQNNWLRGEYAKLNDRLNALLLPAPNKSIWDKLCDEIRLKSIKRLSRFSTRIQSIPHI